MRKTYDKDFKAKVAIEALKGDKTIQELGQIYQVHPNLITQWKRQLLDNAANIFERTNKVPEGQVEAEAKQELLLKEVGQLQVENRFLKKKYKELYGHEPKL
jgi:transposase-like protein